MTAVLEKLVYEEVCPREIVDWLTQKQSINASPKVCLNDKPLLGQHVTCQSYKALLKLKNIYATNMLQYIGYIKISHA